MDLPKLNQAVQAMNLIANNLTPPPTPFVQANGEIKQHLQQFDLESDEEHNDNRTRINFSEVAAAPLFSSRLKQAVQPSSAEHKPLLPAYGLLGVRTTAYHEGQISKDLPRTDNLVYANLQHPWSTFICGQQGAGKSHTMSCLLENALLKNNIMGPNPKPKAGVVFHYDKFTSAEATQVCEAAYLCSKGIKVQVLVSPASLSSMRKRYANLPGLPKNSPQPEVIPFLFNESQLNVANMKTLMGMDNDDKSPPLYMSVVNNVLKELAVVPGATSVVKYREMKNRVANAGLMPAQTSFLEMRYSLIEWFLNETAPKAVKDNAGKIKFQPGTVLIVDLSCPFVTESDACSLFSIFLSIFLAQRGQRPLIIALDEAHKFLTESPAAKAFTEDLVQIIRQQRHLAARVIIATQEPSISPKLLDLCNVAIVHQFQSPEWYSVLKKHLAALATTRNHDGNDGEDVFKTIVRLRRGEALVFCPKAYFDVDGSGEDVELRPLDDGYAKIMVRKKLTADGGRSIVASDTMH